MSISSLPSFESTKTASSKQPNNRCSGLIRAVAASGHSPLALTRINQAIETLTEQILSGQFEIRSASSNICDIPERTRDFFTELNFYGNLGRKWEALFERISLPLTGHLLDLCPGFSGKIELGLHYYGFKGNVTAIDGLSESLQLLQEFTCFFLPDYTFRTLNQKIEEVTLKGDTVCGNHILDDFLLQWYCNKQGLSLTDLYSSEDGFISAVTALSHLPSATTGQCLDILVDRLFSLCRPGGTIILTQYQSYFERSLQLEFLSSFMKQQLYQVGELLRKQGCQKIPYEEQTDSVTFDRSEVLILKR